MFPVLKKADWRSVRKKRDIRASDKVSDRKGGDDSAVGTTGAPLVCAKRIVLRASRACKQRARGGPR